MSKVVVSNHYSGVTPFLPVVGVILLGLVAALFGYIWAWPFVVGSAAALVIWTLAKKNPDEHARKFHGGLALTFFVSALVLGALGAIAVAVSAL
jgi:hypothetical protein